MVRRRLRDLEHAVDRARVHGLAVDRSLQPHGPAWCQLTGRRSSSGADPELLALRGARFIAGVESGEGRELNEVLVKRLLGVTR